MEESASRMMITFGLSSMGDVSMFTRHFEIVVLVGFGDSTPRLLLNKSKHSRRLTLFDSAAHLVMSFVTSAFAESGAARTKKEKAANRNLGLKDIKTPNI
jgi:hypothetical protein